LYLGLSEKPQKCTVFINRRRFSRQGMPVVIPNRHCETPSYFSAFFFENAAFKRNYTNLLCFQMRPYFSELGFVNPDYHEGRTFGNLVRGVFKTVKKFLSDIFRNETHVMTANYGFTLSGNEENGFSFQPEDTAVYRKTSKNELPE